MQGRKTGGRVKGVPNKATADVKALCRGLLGDAAYQATFKARFLEGRLPPAVECLVWHYAYGKPTEHHEHGGEGGGPIRHQVTFEVVGG
jgi:hypothetical protein